MATLADVVELMYRADWTTLSLALEVTEVDDYEARIRLLESMRPSWVPPAGSFRDRASRSPHRPSPWPGPDDEDEAGDEDEDEGAGPQLPGRREQSYRLLIEPGARFREQRTGRSDDAGAAGSGEVPPAAELLLPAWLPAELELELAGPAIAAGRPGHRLIGRPRPVTRGRLSRPGQSRRLQPPHRSGRAGLRLDGIDRVEAVVDAEMGILLRSELMHRGQTVSSRQVTAVTVDPPAAAHDSQSAADPDDDAGHGVPFSGPGWERAKTVANAGATVLSFAIRHAPHREPPAGSRPGAPPDYPRFRSEEKWPGPPGPDEPLSAGVIQLLYSAGLRQTAFDAELGTWADATTTAEAVQRLTRNIGLSGVAQLGDAIGERATTWQSRERVSVGLPDKYRIDYIDGGPRQRKVRSEACDGSTRWRLFGGHVSVGTALPMPAAVARLADPSWLLDWRLTGGAEVTLDGRRGYLIRIRPRGAGPGPQQFGDMPAEAVADAETGILLRLSQELDGRPSAQQALTDFTILPGRESAAYRPEITPRMRVVQDSGTILDTAELSPPAQTAVRLTVKALGAAGRFGSFVESLRESRNRQGPDGS